jgi:hypothetical protein
MIPTNKQVASYAGLTARESVRSALLPRAHLQAGLALANFYQRLRKRSSAKIARFAATTKLADICWRTDRLGATTQCGDGSGLSHRKRN